ncbi:MAG: putative DNA primase/helicase [Desulfobacteraceae bacterium Eth-SRB2]|nr:MAG: putative DNA primase/helicase [Desulfobacteraceae bacterium Eth-SRB2]
MDNSDIDVIKKKVEARRQKIQKEFPGDKEIVEFSGNKILQMLDCGEDGDAWLFIALHRGRFCYDPYDSCWFEFYKNYWREDCVDQVVASIEDVIEEYGKEINRQHWLKLKAEKNGDTSTADKHKTREGLLLKRIRALHNFFRKKNVLRLARSGQDSLCITGTEWDSDPWLLGCPNGIFDLKNEIFRSGRPEDFLKTVTTTKWKGYDAPRPMFDQFILDISNGDVDLVNYLQRLFGYSILGKVTLHIFIIFYGQGRNGKGTLLEILKYILGSLAYKTNFDFLLENKFKSEGPTPEIIALRGKRLVWASETSEGRALNISKLKEVVGGDTLNARAPYAKRQIEFQPSHTLFLLTNHRPHADSSDYALWKRMHLVPFTKSFVSDPIQAHEHKEDPELFDKLKKEDAGILAWLIEGNRKFKQSGLQIPKTVKEATKMYKQDEDLVGQFIKDRCVMEPYVEIKAGDLYKAYEIWCDETASFLLSKKKFGMAMKSRFDFYNKRWVFYVGITLIK